MYSPISEIIQALGSRPWTHSRESDIYSLLDEINQVFINESNLDDPNNGSLYLRQFGEIIFPYVEMGAINTKHLFAVDELIIYAYYYANKDRYRRVADLGANLGIHSIVMSKCGWDVEAFEPDPKHYAILKENLSKNHIDNVNPNLAAVSDVSGECEFVRVLGNTTSSHLTGAKDNAYGKLEHFNVETIAANLVFKNVDFIKMDVEGSENKIILSTNKGDWDGTDAMLEVGNEKAANEIYNHICKLGINAFSQKNNWSIVKNLSDIPTSYKEGSLFITASDSMYWE
jgi:FkbM family methyltransferase